MTQRVVSDDRVVDYVSQRIHTRIHPPYSALGLERDGLIVAGVVFNGFNGHAVEVTVAGEPGAFTRSFIRGVGRYVFQGLGCLRISITTHQQHVVDLACRLGGQTEGRKRNHFGEGRDGIVLGILREDWKL